MAGRRRDKATVSKLGKNRKPQFTECLHGLVREQSGGHEGHSCNVHHRSQPHHTDYGFPGTAVSAHKGPEEKAATRTNQPSLFTRFKRAITQAISEGTKSPRPKVESEEHFKILNFKKAESAFPFKDMEGSYPPRNAQETPISPVHEPHTSSAHLSSTVRETVAQPSRTVAISQPPIAAVQEVEDPIDDDQVDQRMREEMAEYAAKEAKFGGITRNRKVTNRKRQPPSRVGPYRNFDSCLSNDPFIGPLQRSMSNVKKDLMRTLSKPPFTQPVPNPHAEASASSGFLAQSWDCDSDVEVRSSHSTVEQNEARPVLDFEK